MADMKHSIQIAAPLERVHPLVASGNGFSQWWAADVTESRGVVELGFFNRNTIYGLKPELIEAPGRAHRLCLSGQEWRAPGCCLT